MNGEHTIDTAFKALADPVRREIVERLGQGGELDAKDIEKGFDISQPAVSRHLKRLVSAGLLAVRQDGRYRRFRLRREGIQSVREWAEEREQFWNDRLDRLEAMLSQTDDQR